jgi:hypothetical protein
LTGLQISISSLSQNNDLPLNNGGQYRLALPDEWTRPRLIKAITEILPQTIDALKNRQLCVSCNGAYIVRLILDSVVITNAQNSQPVEAGSVPRYTYTFSFNYRFYGALTVMDSLEHPVERLKLAGTNELFTYSKDYTLPAQGSGPRYQFAYDSSGKIVNDKSITESTKTVNKDTPAHNAKLVLTDAYLRDICEQRIFDIRKKLKD